MAPKPVPADPGWDDDLAWLDQDPVTAAERKAWLDRLAEWDDPPEPEECEGWPSLTTEELAEAYEPLVLLPLAASQGRRGPDQPGSARPAPGESSSRAASFGPGMALDVLAGGPQLAVAADAAADAAAGDADSYDADSYDADSYDGVSNAELMGVLCAWDRVEAHAAARKLAAVAEFIRRCPDKDSQPQGPARMPAGWDEFAADELAAALAESRGAAEGLLDFALALETRLPGTKAALRDGVITASKAQIIVGVTALLDEAEAVAAEGKVLGRAGRLTPGGLRAAIARAVMEVAPQKAKKRREQAAKDARVQRWAEDSGNAALMGRELPPDEVLAADQRITAWARELKAAGLDGDMDVLRARAYLDLLLGQDSRPRPRPDAAGEARPAQPAAGPVPAGFAGKVTVTVPLATLLDLADRPGEIPGIGPVDPWLARDLAAAAARNPRTTWCVTVTDEQGHAVGHGCARPEPGGHRERDGPGVSFTVARQHGPPGGYGMWKLSTGVGGADLIVKIDPITTDECDHRFQANGHDPGVKLRHLSQVRHAACTAPTCRRPAVACDFEHNTPYEAGGRTCLCNGGPKCRHDHRLKQHPKWTVDQLPDGTFRWTTPSGRYYTKEPTRYPV
jgi:Domain of unknown function (DUF222)